MSVAASHQLAIEIGGIPILVRTDSSEFARLLEQRYAGFVKGSGFGASSRPVSELPAFELEVELVPQGQVSGVDELSVRLDSGCWIMERGDFRAEWDLERYQGRVRQTGVLPGQVPSDEDVPVGIVVDRMRQGEEEAQRERDDFSPCRRVTHAAIERVRSILGEPDDVRSRLASGQTAAEAGDGGSDDDNAEPREEVSIEAALEQVERQRPGRDEEDENPDRPVIEPVMQLVARAYLSLRRIFDGDGVLGRLVHAIVLLCRFQIERVGRELSDLIKHLCADKNYEDGEYIIGETFP